MMGVSREKWSNRRGAGDGCVIRETPGKTGVLTGMVVTLVSQELLVVSGTSWLVPVVLVSGVATVLGLPRCQCVCQGCALTVISYRTARRRTVHKMPQRRGHRQVWAAEDQHAPLPPCPLTPDSASVSKHSVDAAQLTQQEIMSPLSWISL